MAAGLPVVATDVGAVASLVGSGRGRLVPAARPEALTAAIGALADDGAARSTLRAAGLAFAADHTVEAQARRLVAWLRTTFPALRWDGAGGTPDA
jgi:glycosyltransferase involved in cell wall biosynthesis